MDRIELHKKLLREQEENPKVETALQIAEQKVELSAYRNERNLMLFPFCSTARKTRFTPIKYRTGDGKRWLIVSPNTEHGMVKIWDFDVLRYALSKAGEVARIQGATFPPYIEFSVYECLKALGRNPHTKRSYEWFEDALKRLSSTVYNGNIFRENEKSEQIFTLIRASYDRDEGSKIISKVRVYFDERLIDSARYSRGLLEIDPLVISEGSGLKKRLLELVKTGMGGSDQWTVGLNRLQELCASEREKKLFKRDIKNLKDIPWAIIFSSRAGGGENVTFSKNKES
jgi:hypothetical protein